MDYQPRKLTVRRNGYSLVELLVVMSIIALIVGATLGATVPTLRAYRLSSSSAQLQADLAYASQVASKLNLPVVFRFYRHADESSGRTDDRFRSYQYLKRDPATGDLLPLKSLSFFEAGIAIHESEKFSTLISLGIQSPSDHDPQIPIGTERSKNYEYFELQFLPDGSTSLQKDKQWAVTLVHENRIENPELPENFRTLVINSVTGTIRKY